MERRHELPTHLGVEDHILGNLSMRQLLLLLSGLAGAYAAWTQVPTLPLAARGVLATTVLVFTLAFALVRPGSRSLAAWVMAIGRYYTLPRVAVWQPCVPAGDNVAPAPAAWSAHTPRLAWASGPTRLTPRPTTRMAVAQ
ncbi:MAG: hypothetical protein ACR2JY_15955 [Chloroflexota bacterium]